MYVWRWFCLQDYEDIAIAIYSSVQHVSYEVAIWTVTCRSGTSDNILFLYSHTCIHLWNIVIHSGSYYKAQKLVGLSSKIGHFVGYITENIWLTKMDFVQPDIEISWWENDQWPTISTTEFEKRSSLVIIIDNDFCAITTYVKVMKRFCYQLYS